MATLLAVLGLQISFWSATAAYLTSEHQRLLQRPLRRSFGWATFALGAATSVAALTALHDALSAVVYWLSAVIAAWSLLVMVTPHRARTALACGASLMLAAAVLG